MSKSKYTGLEVLGLLALAFVLVFYRLFVITRVWNYIAVPLGAHQIGLWNAFCLGLILLAFHAGPYKKSDEDSDELAVGIITTTLKLTFVWGLAYWIGG